MKKQIKEILENKIIQFLSMFIIFMTGNFFALNDYVAATRVKTAQIMKNKAEIFDIKTTQKELDNKIEDLTIQKEKLEANNHAFDIKLSDLNSRLLNTVNYQQVLRKEVKQIAEGKLDIKYFWSIMNNLLVRVRWLEHVQHTKT